MPNIILNPGALIDQPEKEALAGTAGIPGDTNRFVTDQDPRLENVPAITFHASLKSFLIEGYLIA